MSTQEVLTGQRRWWVEASDCLEWLAGLPPDSVDLCLFSPPYEDCRSYGIDFKLSGQAWVDWMVRVFLACRRVCKGLVACVCEGKTKGYRYSATPVLLMADLHRAGVHLHKPVAFHRVGIPGSGGPDWLRNDWEWVICATRGGKLPWSDNVACGGKPKFLADGPVSYRLLDGTRVNEKKGKVMTTTQAGTSTNGGAGDARTVRRKVIFPDKANPGNVISPKVGGGHMGNRLCHENEAPFPEALATFFVRSFCPPGGVCCDPFSGSGTAAAVSVANGRRFVGCDLRQSQVDLTRRRVEGVTPLMEGMV